LATVIDTGDRAANLDLFLKHSWLLVVRVILLAKFTVTLDIGLYVSFERAMGDTGKIKATCIVI
jgi:hypothetical protein